MSEKVTGETVLRRLRHLRLKRGARDLHLDGISRGDSQKRGERRLKRREPHETMLKLLLKGPKRTQNTNIQTYKLT